MTTIPTASKPTQSAYQIARTQLIGWAALMFVIYLSFVMVFPIIPYGYRPGPALDLEMILREAGLQWFAPLYLLGILALFYAFWQVMYTVHALSKVDPEGANSLRWWMLAAGVGFGVVLLWLYPITALDVLLYVVRGRLWALHGQSPLVALPNDFPFDPYSSFAGEFGDEVSPYGPLWEIVARIPLRLGIVELVPATIAMKVISLVSYVVTGWLLGWHARQNHRAYPVSGLTVLTFFAWNPLVLMQGIGNGYNDMLMIALIVLGLVLWQRDQWGWAVFVLTLAALVKITALIALPLFGVALLAKEATWNRRIMKGLAITTVFVVTFVMLYGFGAPDAQAWSGGRIAFFEEGKVLAIETPPALGGVETAVAGRRGFAPASVGRMLLRVFYDPVWSEPLARNAARDLFVLYYAYLLLKLALRKTTFIEAAFMAYFAQLVLGATFRIWYPLWIIPFAAFHLTSRTWWRTFLFGLTAELSIFMYFILWRWVLRPLIVDPDLPVPRQPPWMNYFWTMTLLTVPWTFGVPLLGPILRKRKDAVRFTRSLWI